MILSALTLSCMMWGQAQINTKRIKLGDFTQKITKVVLSGHYLRDAALKDEIAARWRISPYEFCTIEEFNNLKGSDQYYFLLNTKGQFKGENSPGILYFTLVKGGEEALKGIDEMLEVVSIPYAPAEESSGRETIYLPAIIDIIQVYAEDSMDKDITAYGGLAHYTMNISKTDGMKIVFSENDLGEEITQEVKDKFFVSDMTFTDEDTADSYMLRNEPNTLVSYTVCPSNPVKGSFCYKMLIDCETHQLYYFRRHKIGKKLAPGFLLEDIKRISAPRGSQNKEEK